MKIGVPRNIMTTKAPSHLGTNGRQTTTDRTPGRSGLPRTVLRVLFYGPEYGPVQSGCLFLLGTYWPRPLRGVVRYAIVPAYACIRNFSRPANSTSRIRSFRGDPKKVYRWTGAGNGRFKTMQRDSKCIFGYGRSGRCLCLDFQMEPFREWM